jgi:hypothetical protein
MVSAPKKWDSKAASGAAHYDSTCPLLTPEAQASNPRAISFGKGGKIDVKIKSAIGVLNGDGQKMSRLSL